MIYRELGSTGEKVSVIGLGGWHIGQPELSEATGIRIMHSSIDRGINFFDNCWDYNDGNSEIRMGKALRGGHRKKVFLMTKIDARTRVEAIKQLDASLIRLQTDYIDLVQHHEVIRFDDTHRIFAENGSNAVLEEARKAGKIRFIGFTGHKDPSIHKYMLKHAFEKGFKFDTVQMPLNVMDAHYRSFEKEVLPKLVEQKIGVIAMKSLAAGSILESKTVSPIECLHYTMNLPVATVVTALESMKLIDQAIEAVDTFKPMTLAEINSLLARTATAATEGRFELYKTSSIFDGTAANPAWLGAETAKIPGFTGEP
jgi:aryl-alcohol dehydrogenase-like predicted oxidoreductase